MDGSKKKSARFGDIIKRAEELRKSLAFNKSAFARQIGLKPQTYNNFIGAQSSKPNIELIDGIVQRFKVDPMWLLRGEGEVYREAELMEQFFTGAGRIVGRTGGGKAGGAKTEAPEIATQRRKELTQRVSGLRGTLKEVEKRSARKPPSDVPALRYSMEVVKGYFEIDPVYTVHELEALLSDLHKKAAKPKRAS